MDVEVLKPSATHHDPAEYRQKAADFYRQGFEAFGDECTQIANELEREARERRLWEFATAWLVVATGAVFLYKYFAN